jgi:hypothetical protein
MAADNEQQTELYTTIRLAKNKNLPILIFYGGAPEHIKNF